MKTTVRCRYELDPDAARRKSIGADSTRSITLYIWRYISRVRNSTGNNAARRCPCQWGLFRKGMGFDLCPRYCHRVGGLFRNPDLPTWLTTARALNLSCAVNVMNARCTDNGIYTGKSYCKLKSGWQYSNRIVIRFRSHRRSQAMLHAMHPLREVSVNHLGFCQFPPPDLNIFCVC